MANPADEFWLFCIILIIFIIISVAGVIHFSMKIVRKSYRSGGLLATKDDLIILSQNKYPKPYRPQAGGTNGRSDHPPSPKDTSKRRW